VESAPILELTGLSVVFRTHRGILRGLAPSDEVRALDNVNFEIGSQEVLGLAGETGSGKSTLARTLVGLYSPTAGEVRMLGRTIDYRSREDIRYLRKNVGIVFQDPVGSLNPRLRVKEIIAEAAIASGMPPVERKQRVEEIVQLVGLRESALDAFPRELSGGEKQRVSVARALIVPKKLLVLDEPTSSLDVSVQAQVLNLLRDIRRKLEISILFISHDLRVLKYMSDRVGLLFYGKLVEIADTRQLFNEPRHPYTVELVSHINDSGSSSSSSPVEHKPSATGCRYSQVCPSRFSRCSEEPPMYSVGPGHYAACHLFESEPSSGKLSCGLSQLSAMADRENTSN
jgi:oligopeptide/dipeptide ABC transporter ATP-binding protein